MTHGPSSRGPGAQEWQCPGDDMGPSICQGLGGGRRLFSPPDLERHLEIMQPRGTMNFSEIDRGFLVCVLVFIL